MPKFLVEDPWFPINPWGFEGSNLEGSFFNLLRAERLVEPFNLVGIKSRKIQIMDAILHLIFGQSFWLKELISKVIAEGI